MQIIENMLYMVVEHFKDEVKVYRRFRDKGRLAPEGVKYISSWIDTEFKQCFQLMETDDAKLLGEWMANWNDIVEFEIFPVMTSAEAAAKMTERI